MNRFLPLLFLVATTLFAGYPETPGTGTFTTIENVEYARVAVSARSMQGGGALDPRERRAIPLRSRSHRRLRTSAGDMYGPVDLLKIDEQKLPCYGNLSANSPLMPPSLLMGCAIQSCREKTMTSNPMNYITRDDPPFLILQGQQDCLTPWQQSQMLYDALRANGVSAELHLLPTAEHADHQFDDQQWKQTISDWLDANLRGPTPMPRRRAVK